MSLEAMDALFEDPGDVAYFNAANIGPRLKAVSAAGREAIDAFARPWEIGAGDWFSGPEALRTEFAKLTAVDADAIALIPSVSYGIAIAARNLAVPEGAELVLVEEQYPSNVYAWRRVAQDRGARIRIARRGEHTALSDAVVDSINDSTSVVAIPHCHWTDGEPIDLLAVAQACRHHGAALVIDASQSLGVRPIDLDLVRPDFLVTVGYKWLLGAYGLGYLYCDEKWRQHGIPIEESWLTRAGSEDFSNLVNYVDGYRPGARRFDFGEFPQFVSLPMSLAALRQMNAWGVARIAAHLRAVTGAVRSAAEEAGVGLLPVSRCAEHMVSLPFATRSRAMAVNDRLRAAKLVASVRGNCIRISPHMNTTASDVGRLCELIRVSARGA